MENDCKEVLRVLKRAIDENKKVRIIYESAGDYSERTIRVIALQTKDVRAYCYMRHARRIFKLNGILSAQLLENN